MNKLVFNPLTQQFDFTSKDVKQVEVGLSGIEQTITLAGYGITTLLNVQAVKEATGEVVSLAYVASNDEVRIVSNVDMVELKLIIVGI